MILLIDNSNTRTKLMFATEKGLLEETLIVVPTAELTQERILSLLEGAEFSAVVIASVVPWAAVLLQSVFAARGTNVLMLNADTSVDGVVYDYPGMSTLGADRVANVVAAARFYPLPCIAIDAGTAVTYDVVVPSEQGACYVGGAISPGISTMLASLNKGTAMLPHVGLESPVAPIGKSTCEAIQSGVFWGAKGMVEALVKQVEEVCGPMTSVIMTGGDARLLASVLPCVTHVDEWLTFRGLWQVSQGLH